MSEETKPQVEPFTEEELMRLAKRLEDDNELDSELARAIFTILIVGHEYQTLYTTLQAYYAASVGACHDLAGACASIIGLKDTKKINKMFTVAATISAEIPNRAISILNNYSDAKVNEDDN